MEGENQISRIGIQFGEDQQDEHKQFLQAKLVINKDAANTQLYELENKTENSIPIGWSVVVAVNVTEENIEAIQNYITKVQEKDKEFDNASFYPLLIEKIEKHNVQIQQVKVGSKLYISVKMGEEHQASNQENFEQFLEMGLNDIVSTQNNQIDVKLSSATSADQFIQKVDGGEPLSSVLLENAKFECKMSLNENLGEKLKKFMNEVDPEFANSPPFVILRYFKSLDIDMRFSSSQELPENIRKNIFLGKMLEGANSNLDLSQYKAFSLLESLNTEVEAYITIPDFACFSVEGHNLAVSKLIQNYGNYKAFGL